MSQAEKWRRWLTSSTKADAFFPCLFACNLHTQTHSSFVFITAIFVDVDSRSLDSLTRREKD
jgi:hypothetical protein